jgi:hypothetical protein
MRVVDIKEHEDAQERYLLAMLDLTEEMEKTDSRPGRLLNIGESEIAEKAAIDAANAYRISDELKDDGLIESQGTLTGRAHHFTTDGRRFAEEIRYKKTPVAKRREIVGVVKEKATAGLFAALGKLSSWIGGVVIGAIGATYGPAITKWVRELLGIK